MEPETSTQLCPKCLGTLLHVERGGMIIELCSSCRGQYLDPGELTELLELYRRVDPETGTPSDVLCLRCETEMRELSFPRTEVQIDVCPACHGVWLDAGELELLRRNASLVVPRRDATLSQRAREILSEAERAGEQRFSCPKCKAKLWHLKRQGIVFELCSGCEGMWFDAGELTVLIGLYRRLEAEAGTPTAFACVRCDEDMRELPFPGTEVQIDCCPACQGIWLDKGEFRQLKDDVKPFLPDEQAHMNERASEILTGLDLGARVRSACPKCDGRLDTNYSGGVPAERCTGCGGTWLDAGDLTRILSMSRKLRLKEAGATEVGCIRCPSQSLVELHYPGTRVQIDVCPDCRGVWLDHGEVEELVMAVRPGGA